MQISAIVSLKTSYENLGDLVINSCLVSRLCVKGKVLCISTGVPAWYLKEFQQVTTVQHGTVDYLADPVAILTWIARELRSTQQLVLFMSPGAIPFAESHQRTLLLVVSKLIRRLRFAQVGASYTRLGPKTIRLLRSVTRNPHHISVRDPVSQQELANNGITVPIVPDLAFCLGRQSSVEKRYFVLSFRLGPEENELRFVSRLTPMVVKAHALGLEPIMFWQVNHDRELTYRLSAALDVDIYPDVATPRPTLRQAAQLYERTAVICSNRLHGLLIAAAHGALPLALLAAGEQKIANSFLESGLVNLVSQREEDDPALLVLLTQHAEVSHTVDQQFCAAAKRIDVYFDSLGT